MVKLKAKCLTQEKEQKKSDITILREFKYTNMIPKK